MLLVIDTALAGLSVALLAGDTVLADDHRLLGRGHAETVIPAVASVLAAAGVAAPSAILVDTGPGSFTGLRIGIAAARALALAWDIPVSGYHATALVAARAFADHPGLDKLVAVLDAGRGQLYVQIFDRDGLLPRAPVVALSPEMARSFAQGLTCAGPGAALLPGCNAINSAWPRAADVQLLPGHACALDLAPLYVRAPDAQLPQAVLPRQQAVL